jgi:uncharacterized protein YybS (DUF2232 family)
MSENSQQDHAIRGGSALFLSVAAPLLSGLMFMSVFYVPIFGLAFNFFSPLPVIYHLFTHGRKITYISVAVVTTLIIIASDIEIGLFYISTHALIAVITAEMILRRDSMEKSIIYGASIPLAISMLLLLLSAPAPIADLYGTLVSNTSTILNETVRAYTQAGIPPEQTAILSENIEAMAGWIVKLMPSTALAAYLMLTLGNYLAYKKIQGRFTFLPEPKKTKLGEWYPPEKTVFILIAGGAMAFLFSGFLGAVGANILIITLTVYSIAGIAVMQFFMAKFKVPFFLRLLAYSLIMIQPAFLSMVAGFGLFDLWFDFRNIKGKKGSGKDEN